MAIATNAQGRERSRPCVFPHGTRHTSRILMTVAWQDDATVEAWVKSRRAMPEISRFYGIIITMFYREHSPAHFHAVYGEYGATFEIENGEVEGVFPARQRKLVLEWARLHRVELMEDWKQARARRPLQRIAPLG